MSQYLKFLLFVFVQIPYHIYLKTTDSDFFSSVNLQRCKCIAEFIIIFLHIFSRLKEKNVSTEMNYMCGALIWLS